MHHSAHITASATPLQHFETQLRNSDDLISDLQRGLIGKGMVVDGRFGPKPLIYADYVASGRALRQIEDFVMERLLPVYANSHTEASFCGAQTTQMREEARDTIARLCGARPEEHAVIFAGSGATGPLNRLVHVLGIPKALRAGLTPHVLVGPYEHHSNLLPWRECGAQVHAVKEGAGGGPDLEHLVQLLAELTPLGPVICTFSAASNVTGVCSDVAAVTRVVKRAGARIVWDYAGGAPYLPINMTPAPDVEIDAVCLSAHKFLGGPGASGVMVVRRDAVRETVPSAPGGGTVVFVNHEKHDYSTHVEDREEGGTPNIIGDIRAALCMITKSAVGQDWIATRNAELTRRAFSAWRGVPGLVLLGQNRQDRLPILSFTLQPKHGQAFDYQLFTTLLSERYGVQARGGCSCAGPYVHELLNIGADRSEQLRSDILAGDDSHKPGFVRLNLSYLIENHEADYILNAVAELAQDYWGLARGCSS